MDDLSFDRILFKPCTFNNQTLVQQPNTYITYCMHGLNHITKCVDRQFRIIYEDIEDPKQYDYISKITGEYFKKDETLPYSLYYDSDINSVTSSTFTLTYENIDGKIYECLYNYYNSFPQAYRQLDTITKQPCADFTDINNISVTSGANLPCNYIKGAGFLMPIEECFRACSEHNTYYPFQYFLRSSAVIKPVSVTSSQYEISGKKYNCFDYYITLNEFIQTNSAYLCNSSGGNYTFRTANSIFNFISNGNIKTQDKVRLYQNYISGKETSGITINPLLLCGLDYTNYNLSEIISGKTHCYYPPIDENLSSYVLTNDNKTIGFSNISGLRNMSYIFRQGDAGIIYWIPAELKLPTGTYLAAELFQSQSNLTTIEANTFDTPYLWYLDNMFYGCSSLKDLSQLTINLSGISKNPGDQLQTIQIRFSNMFYGCTLLEQSPHININVSKTARRSLYTFSMFRNCTSLKNINLLIDKGQNDTCKIHISNADYMFQNCLNLVEIPSALTTIKTATNMFYNCISLSSIPTSSTLFNNDLDITWTGYYTRSFKNTFNNCSSLLSCNIDLPNTIIDWRGLFKNCTSLSGINLSSFIPDYAAGRSVNASQAFYNCSSLIYNVDYVQSIKKKLIANTDIQKTVTDMFYGTKYQGKF